MSNSTETIVSDVPLFDVFVEIPPNTQLETIEKLALHEAQLPPERVEALIKALRSGPKAKIGAKVTRERGETAKNQFSKAGLKVTVVPVLSLQALVTGSFDGRFTCPACNERVMLTEDRQCPSCKVYVDKVDEEYLLKRKIMQQERAKLDFQAARETKESEKNTRRALENALRAKIREELEDEYGIKMQSGFFQGKGGLVRAGSTLTLLVAAFFGGHLLPADALPWSKKTSHSETASSAEDAKVDQLLSSSLGAPDSAAGTMDGDLATGDPDVDGDPMLQAIGGQRVGAKGISMEQALKAATVLAKSVGNNTVERVQAGLPVGGGALGAPDDAGTPMAVPAGLKLRLAADFALGLAELGQDKRAQGVLAAIRTSPALANASDATLQLTTLAVRAWALQSLPEGKARSAADALRAEATAMATAEQRAQALIRIADILSQQPPLGSDPARAFLTLASPALREVSDAAQKQTLLGQWMLAMGRATLNDVRTQAKSGLWVRAKKSAETLENLSQQGASGTLQAQLLALDFMAKHLLGNADAANNSLAGALALAESSPLWAERAAILRAITPIVSPAGDYAVQSAASAMAAQLNPAAGVDQAQALTQLALLQARTGNQEAINQLSQTAESASSLSAADLLHIKSDLIVRTDIAMAQALHTGGQYAQAEVLLQRVSDYLF